MAADYALREGALVRSDFKRTDYFIEVASGTPFSAVLAPDFYRHVARRLKVHDCLEVVAEDGSFDATVRVVEVNEQGLYAKVRVLRLWTPAETVDAPAPEAPTADGYRVEFVKADKWRVIDPQNTVIFKGLASEVEAKEALARFLEKKGA